MGHFPLALKLHDVSWLHGVDIIVFRKRQLNFFVVRAVGKVITDRSVGKIIIIVILNFKVSISKNKNIDNRVKETCDICQYKLHYDEIDYISVLLSFNHVKCTKYLFFLYLFFVI